MKKRLLEFIHCPNCKGELKLSTEEVIDDDIITGKISCKSCNSTYPIIKSIPRFLPDIKSEEDLRNIYADSFGHQWNTYHWEREVDEYEFFTITDLNKEYLENKIILDVGCGGGRIARFVSTYCKEFFALDYSVAIERAHEICKDESNAHFIQCDINCHPFKEGMFDFVYSHGVLHHTPDTKKSFDNLPPLVKKGGKLYIAVFRKAFILLRLSDSFWRFIINKLPYSLLDKVCGALSYLSYLPYPVFFKRFFWFSLSKTHELRKYSLFDWYGPKYHFEHTVNEVLLWFEDSGFRPKYINAWPYCPEEIKYKIPWFFESFRLGQLLGVIGDKI